MTHSGKTQNALGIVYSRARTAERDAPVITIILLLFVRAGVFIWVDNRHSLSISTFLLLSHALATRPLDHPIPTSPISCHPAYI